MTALSAAIFDVDGVLVDSPHERAWRETLEALMEGDWSELRTGASYSPERFTAEVYQRVVAGKPRLSGARAALDYFGVADAAERAEEYARLKQHRVMDLIEAGEFVAFPDALRFVLALRRAGVPMAAASSSKNADLLLARTPMPDGAPLLDCFDADTSGRDFAHGKPYPDIFLGAAEALGVPPGECLVVEDAAPGIEAARAGGMAALGVARRNDQDLLAAAGADLVVTTLDDVNVDRLLEGRLSGGKPRTRIGS